MSQGPNDTAALEARVAAVETQLQRYKAAFDAISQGVCLFDNEQRVIVGNRPYAEIYGLSPDQIPPGTTLGEITERRAAVGNCPMATGAYLSYVESINAKRARSRLERQARRRPYDPHSLPANARRRLVDDARGRNRSARKTAADRREGFAAVADRRRARQPVVKDAESRFVVANRATALRIARRRRS